MTREIDSIERIRAGPSQGGKPPDQMSPQELHSVLWQVLSFRDSGESSELRVEVCKLIWVTPSREEDREDNW